MHHRQIHPAFQPGCYSCKLLSIGISAHALETKGKPVVAIDHRERKWTKNHQAYRALRKDGLQPRGLDGAYEVQEHAEHRLEVEMGHALKKEQIEAFESCS